MRVGFIDKDKRLSSSAGKTGIIVFREFIGKDELAPGRKTGIIMFGGIHR